MIKMSSIQHGATTVLLFFVAWASAQQCSEDSFSIVYAGRTAFAVSNNDSSCTCAGALRSLQGVSYIDTLVVNDFVVTQSSNGVCPTSCVAPLQAQLAALNASFLALQLLVANLLATGCSGGGSGSSSGWCLAPPPDNGIVIGDVTRISDGGTITYACTAGYTMSGYTSAKCVGGQFDHPRPVCNPNPCTSTAPVPGSVFPAPTVPHNVTATYACNSGYTLVGSSTRTCLLGNLTGTQPTCSPNNCTATAPAFGSVTSTLIASGSSLTYSCNSGYTMSGTATQTCTAGSLSGIRPTCNPNPCTTSGVIYGGPAISIIPSGSTVTYYCNPGSPLSGANVTAGCLAGVLSAPPPVCGYATSCDTLLQAVPMATNGTYTISPSGTPFPVYCEMASTGGWTLVNVRGIGVAMFGETAYSPLLKSNLPGRLAEIWYSSSPTSFRQLRYTNDNGYFATVDFGATTSLNILNTAFSSYTWNYNYAVSSTNAGGLTYFIMRGQSGTSCSGWVDSCDFTYMAFVDSSSISSYGDYWDYNYRWWILSGTDNTYDPATYATPQHSGLSTVTTGTCHWSYVSSCGSSYVLKPTYVWIK
eukprot:TRINITY_DN3889_c0_g2_i1.p1 TRINITY_DN3889_c0_g2~~TRINITY_DN3889_c0_g2_i1.p1  ORF type:complete len:618 (-),score=118.50 TRINITY_DN3889_c0_g2_i1:1388-3145(-)